MTKLFNIFSVFALVFFVVSLLQTSLVEAKKFSSGNLLITDPDSFTPWVIYEFDTDGNNIHNYTLTINGQYLIPIDLAFLSADSLLILDLEKGLYSTDHKGNVQGIWNGLATHTGRIGCDLEKLAADVQNNRVYVTSRNIKCDNSNQVGVFVYDLNGNLKTTLTNSAFNMTLGIAGDSTGNIWITDVDQIFIYDVYSETYKTIDPLSSKEGIIAYNGILITDDDRVYVSVPAEGHDLVIEMDTYGNIKQKIELVGNTYVNGSTSGFPGTMAIVDDTLIVEVPYASKKEGPDASDVIEFYDINDGTLQSSFGGHSCKEKHILCIPFNGLVVIPEDEDSLTSSSN